MHLLLQFFTFVALPSYVPMTQAFPACTPILEAVRANYQYWAKQEGAVRSSEAGGAKESPGKVQ